MFGTEVITDLLNNSNYLSNFILFSGFVIGLGAVTIIDIIGFLGMKSSYWSETTIRVHKITKPLIWIGITVLSISLLLTRSDMNRDLFLIKTTMIIFLIINGSFLSFYISPILLNIEKSGQTQKILPKNLQFKIFISFVVSFLLWWGLFILSIFEISF